VIVEAAAAEVETSVVVAEVAVIRIANSKNNAFFV
jgi:hypothetical protein